MIKRCLPLLTLAAALVNPWPAFAELSVGAPAPDFSTPASLGGEVFTFQLNEALKQGPVVLYFYPAAFTQGCTIEARNFAEATDDYKALGATVIGVSADDIETLKKFSVSECRSKFAVAADGDQTSSKPMMPRMTVAPRPRRGCRTSYRRITKFCMPIPT